MTTLSIAVLGSIGLTWPLWKRLVSEVEELGFAGLYFNGALPHALGAYNDSLEPMVALTYLADHSRRVQIGTAAALMVAHDPVTLARQAVALDDLSGGRFMLGLGTGGAENRMFGYGFGHAPAPFGRFGEALEVITRLLRSTEPVTFTGRFYHLENAMVLPHPQRNGCPPVMVAGNGPKRLLPLVARYANIWDGRLLTPEAYVERSALLDELLKAEGRQPKDVKRIMSLRMACGRSPAELERNASWLRRQVPMLADLPLDTLMAMMQAQFGVLVGPPEMLVQHIHALSAAGVEEIILEWSALDDIEGLRLIAEAVLPHI